MFNYHEPKSDFDKIDDLMTENEKLKANKNQILKILESYKKQAKNLTIDSDELLESITEEIKKVFSVK